jgi:hypothetical protein
MMTRADQFTPGPAGRKAHAGRNSVRHKLHTRAACFVMIHSKTKRLISNVLLLCRSCNSAKSDRDIRDVLRQLDDSTRNRMLDLQIQISVEMLKDFELLEKVEDWYSKKIASLPDLEDSETSI